MPTCIGMDLPPSDLGGLELDERREEPGVTAEAGVPCPVRCGRGAGSSRLRGVAFAETSQGAGAGVGRLPAAV